MIFVIRLQRINPATGEHYAYRRKLLCRYGKRRGKFWHWHIEY